jgi:hypothetical protein
MKAYVIQDEQGWPEEVFVGNNDDLSDADFKSLRKRLLQLGRTVKVRGTEPVAMLKRYIESLEEEAKDALSQKDT